MSTGFGVPTLNDLPLIFIQVVSQKACLAVGSEHFEAIVVLIVPAVDDFQYLAGPTILRERDRPFIPFVTGIGLNGNSSVHSVPFSTRTDGLHFDFV